jgi:hypothetical protein
MNGHFQNNIKVPHITLISIAISIAVTVIVVSILNMVDHGTMGIGYAEAAKKFEPRGP